MFATSVVFPTVALDRARIRTIVTAAHTDEHARPGARGLRPRRARAGRDPARDGRRAEARRGRHAAAGRGRARGLAGGDRRRARERAGPAARRAPPHGPVARRERAAGGLLRPGRRARHPSSSRSPTTWTSTRRCRPTGSPRSWTGSATCAGRPSAGRTVGLAIRFGVEVTYERRYEDEIRGWLRRHPHDYVIGSVHISAALAVQGGARRRVRRGSAAGGDRRALLRRGDRRRRGRGCSTPSATSTS